NLANTMTWHDVTTRDYSLGSLSAGTGQFTTTPAIPIGELRVHIPVNYRGNASYRADRWSALAEIARDWDKTSFRAGYEGRFSHAELRGAVAYHEKSWLPSFGV